MRTAPEADTAGPRHCETRSEADLIRSFRRILRLRWGGTRPVGTARSGSNEGNEGPEGDAIKTINTANVSNTNNANHANNGSDTSNSNNGSATMTSPATPASTVGTQDPKRQFLEAFRKEHATTRKVLRAFPREQSAFKPHERSSTAHQLAFTFLMEQKMLLAAFTDTLRLGAGMPPMPDDFEAMLGEFERDFEVLCGVIDAATPESLSTPVKFPVGPGQIGDWPKLQFAWFMLCDQIHHRGQLSVYLRMVGGKVPSIYGPSGDGWE